MPPKIVRLGHVRKTLNVVEKQVLVLYISDVVAWPWRMLLWRVTAAWWVIVSPDLEVFVEDSDGDATDSGERGFSVIEDSDESDGLQPLRRNVAYPEDLRPIYAVGRLDDATLARVLEEARELADAMGLAPPAIGAALPGQAVWLFSDMAFSLFGQGVPTALTVQPDSFVRRDATGMVLADGGTGEEYWTSCEHILPSDTAETEKQKEKQKTRTTRRRRTTTNRQPWACLTRQRRTRGHPGNHGRRLERCGPLPCCPCGRRRF